MTEQKQSPRSLDEAIEGYPQDKQEPDETKKFPEDVWLEKSIEDVVKYINEWRNEH